MKNLTTSALILITLSFLAFTPGKKTSLVSGDDSFLKESVTIFVEFDLSKTSIDGLDSEEEFVEYKKGKEKKQEGSR